MVINVQFGLQYFYFVIVVVFALLLAKQKNTRTTKRPNNQPNKKKQQQQQMLFFSQTYVILVILLESLKCSKRCQTQFKTCFSSPPASRISAAFKIVLFCLEFSDCLLVICTISFKDFKNFQPTPDPRFDLLLQVADALRHVASATARL